jgi:type I restriction enzyme S subunit
MENNSIYKLGDVCDLITDGKHGDCMPQVGSGFYFLSAKDVYDGELHYEGAREITERDFLETHRRTRFSAGDILITNSGTIGRMAIAEDNALTRKTTFQKSVAILKPKKTIVQTNYLYYELQATKKILIDLAVGSAQPNLLLGDLRKFKVKIPDLKTQHCIASILSAYDDLIDVNNKRITLLEQMAVQIYKEWFVRMRFPGYENAEFEKGVPKGWEITKVEKAFKYQAGGTPAKDVQAYWKDGDVNWFTPTDITGSKSYFLEGSSEKCNEFGVSKSSAKLFPAYSLMMTSRATIGEIGINTTVACTNQGFITCIPNKRLPLPFLFYWLKLNKNYFISLSTGATFGELIKSTFKRIGIIIPDEKLTKKYNEIVAPMFKQIEILQKENQIIKQTRDLLLPRLISGKLRVKEFETTANKR